MRVAGAVDASVAGAAALEEQHIPPTAVQLAENTPSARMVQACGFRLVGRRERLGELHGRWRDVLLFERRRPAG